MSKNPYELVSTKPESDDEGSSEEETFFESNKLKTVVKKSGKSRQLINPSSPSRNRIFLVAALVTVLLIVSLIAGYIAYEALNPTTVRPTSPPNETSPIGPQASLVSSPASKVFHNTHPLHHEPSPTTSTNKQSSPTNSPTVGSTQSSSASVIEWYRNIYPASSEMSVVVHDINNDGTPDLIFDTIHSRFFHEKYRICPEKENHCMEDVGVSPCRIRILALDGQNGSNVWEKWVEFAPFAANCRHDLNLDGVADCVFAGRQGSFVVINPVDGSFLWIIDSAPTFPGYSYYYPLFIHDFDKDGVVDMIVTHGGDQIYQDKNKNRSNGFIFVISGRTGQQISDRIPMPDGQETYSNPIAYNISGNIELVLFGSGGETLSGSLWAITVQSLQEHVDTWAHKKPDKYSPNQVYFDTQCMSDEEVGSMRPVFQQGTFKYVKDKEEWLSRCPILYNQHEPLWNPYKLCVYEFVPGGKTGTMLPPVIIDYNGDGVKDLLVSQFNDHIIMIDGSSGNIQWNHTADDTQSYSIPSPLHFNEDNTPDFLIRFNKGKWMNYDYSYMGVLDGNNGELLWMMNCSMGAMASAVTVKSSRKGHDGMLFFASGCKQEMNRMKKDTKEKRVFQQVDEENMCPQAHLGLEQAICNIRERSRRHGDKDESEDENYIQVMVDNYGNPIDIAGGDGPPDYDTDSFQVFRPQDVDFSLLKDYIPSDLWVALDGMDHFPDPWTDTRTFVQDYCEIPYDTLTSRVYYLTPNMIKLGIIKPLYVHRPFVYKPPSSGYEKRHGEPAATETERLKNILKNRKAVRCAHVLLPIMMAATPTVGDFNEDGKLDATLSITYDGFPGELSMLFPLHPPTVSVTTFTIEDKLKEIYGPEINDIVDFSSYYPADKQPWGQYMGAKGDGVYEPPSS